MLEVGELGAGVGRGGFARVEDLGAEFGAGGAEEVDFLRFHEGGKASVEREGGWGGGGQ